MSSDQDARNHALDQISSPIAHQRYTGAKTLVKFGTPEDLKILMVARNSESDSYVKKWLGMAIAACGRRRVVPPYQSAVLTGVDESVMSQLRAEAVEYVAGTVLHEIGSKLGLLSSAARREIDNYSVSETARHIENLEKIFDAIAQLRKASAMPKLVEFDIAQLVADIVGIEAGDLEVSLVGRKPLNLLSDPVLLRLALCNGIRNAVEAVRAMTVLPAHPIVISWEVTDREYWVTVLDQGPGVIGNTDSVFEIGRSTKAGHTGFGLSIAKQAVDVLGGSITLHSSVGGGALFEIKGEHRR